MRHLPNRGAHAPDIPAFIISDAVDHGQAARTDAEPVDAADAVTDARTVATVDARTDAWPIANADAVNVVCRRRHLVLRLVLAERLRVRRPEAQAL